MHSTEP